jgi:hypothetical protein
MLRRMANITQTALFDQCKRFAMKLQAGHDAQAYAVAKYGPKSEPRSFVTARKKKG